jgi:antitoxin component YwqK of YwqJK toxin-antitoxin module
MNIVTETWYENGQMSSREVSDKGILIEQQQWYENGVLKDSMSKEKNEERYENGKLKSMGTTKPGDDHVVSMEYYENGIRKSVEYEDHPDGLLRETWYENGNPKTRQTRIPGSTKLISEYWYENGQMSARYTNDNSEEQRWYENGVQQFDRSMGTTTELYESGKVMYICTDKPDVDHVVSRSYFKNGERSNISYVDHPDGLLSESWYESGKLRGRQISVPDV